MVTDKIPRSVIYEDGVLKFLDQRKLPLEIVYEEQKNEDDVYDSIKQLKVRGAPAIGIAAAFGLVISMKEYIHENVEVFKFQIIRLGSYLNSSRPTAVNLSWAINRMINLCNSYTGKDSHELWKMIEQEAYNIYNEDKEICSAIGKYGAELISDNMGILTHCNAGALAVSELGTALAPIYTAFNNGKNVRVYADETRPLLQGARLTAWELMQSGVDVTLICDNMAGFVMSQKKIDLVITGCDRVALNGDTANKIGTLSVAILAKHYNIPFYIACPSSTFDEKTAEGSSIVIEERDSYEVTHFGNTQTAPDGVKVYNPAFDVTPNELIAGFITEQGIIKPPFDVNLKKILNKRQ